MGTTLSILLVDDERISREVAAHLLMSGGHTVTAAALPSEALAIYRERGASFDLVILDMIMPEMSGKELFIELKRVNPGVKAILLSGYGRECDLKEALEAGVSRYLQKPVMRKVLLRAVAEVAAE